MVIAFFVFYYATTLSKHLEGPVKAQQVIFPPPHLFVLSYLNFENKEDCLLRTIRKLRKSELICPTLLVEKTHINSTASSLASLLYK